MIEPSYGVWNVIKKEFQFGIAEPSKNKASKKLIQKIGKGAYKLRFEIRKILRKEVKNNVVG